MTIILTIVSIVRSYAWRRYFNHIETPCQKEDEEVVEAIRRLKTARVFERGTLVMDPKEVYESDKYKQMVRNTNKLIHHDYCTECGRITNNLPCKCISLIT